ncbi:MAG: 30S ribosomal protein S3 [Ignavibacteriales bacterium]|nr:30S ribosomal protein S3 [Ignavibacteriaceae bacterium]QOJ29904.1 MAG: 30S ribosomal protein S3 [Ignavibacteriales bacterium]
MGQKTHPIGFRVGINRGWESNWFEKKSYTGKLLEDDKLRSYIKSRLEKAGISRIIIERTSKNIVVNINTSRPGVVIGRGGEEINKIEKELKSLTEKDVKIQITENKKPEQDAILVADNIAQQLEKRVSYRRAMKQAISAAMRSGADGIKVMCSGRLGGAEIARTDQYKEGKIPLHTLRSDIDFAYGRAETVYGSIGIKVWICRGEILGKKASD